MIIHISHDTLFCICVGSRIKLGFIVYSPPRNGGTIWEIGVPDRSAAEFYIPDASRNFQNKLYNNHPKQKLDNKPYI